MDHFFIFKISRLVHWRIEISFNDDQVCSFGSGAIVRDGLVESLSNYEKDDAARRAWDYFQREFRCCGAENYTDWSQHFQVTYC